MAAIGAQALRSNLGRVADLKRSLQAAGEGTLSEQERQSAIDIAHRLVGSAGTFGYRRVSTRARLLEHFLAETGAGGTVDRSAVSVQADGLVLMEQDLLAGPDEDELD